MAAPMMFVLVQLRGRWRGWLGLALVVGLFAGGVDAIAAGRSGQTPPIPGW